MEPKAYSTEEARVAEWLVEQCGIGGGDDPIGFILASHSLCAEQRNRFRDALVKIAESANKDRSAILAREALATG